MIEFLFELQPMSGNLSLVRDYNEIEISGCSWNVYIHSVHVYVEPLIPDRWHTRTLGRLGLTRIRIDTAE